MPIARHPPPEPGWNGKLLQDVFDAAPDATIGVDESGVITFVNTRAESVFGYERSELLGREVEVLIPDRFRQLHVDERTAFSLAPQRRPMGSGLRQVGRRSDGSEFQAEVSLSPIGTSSGILVLAAVRDVTERVRIEAHTIELEEMLRVKTDIIRILSHELFTPITTIQGTASTLMNNDPSSLDPGALRGLIAGVATASARLSRLLRHVDAAATVELGAVFESRTAVPIGVVLQDALEDSEVGPFAERIRIDRGSIDLSRRVLVNEQLAVLAIVVVLENALALAPGEPIDVELSVAGEEVQVRISDRGPGIPEDLRERAFYLFNQLDASDTRPHGGLGIGLFLAHKIVEAHGGRMEVLLRDPVGSTFLLPLPLAP
jgi:PAS domain S-box-containing protein